MSRHGSRHHATHPGNGDGANAPYWKRAHHDWRFWVAAFLAFAAMLTYVMSMDLAWRPRAAGPRQTAPAVHTIP